MGTRTPDSIYENVIKDFNGIKLPNKLNDLINSLVDITFFNMDGGMQQMYCIRTIVQGCRISDLTFNGDNFTLVICIPPVPFHGIKVDGVRLCNSEDKKSINLVHGDFPKERKSEFEFSCVTICSVDKIMPQEQME